MHNKQKRYVLLSRGERVQRHESLSSWQGTIFWFSLIETQSCCTAFDFILAVFIRLIKTTLNQTKVNKYIKSTLKCVRAGAGLVYRLYSHYCGVHGMTHISRGTEHTPACPRLHSNHPDTWRHTSELMKDQNNVYKALHQACMTNAQHCIPISPLSFIQLFHNY